MESRKVQRVGQATLAISLPNTWAKEHNVKQGDQITFIPERDGSLKLIPKPITEKGKESRDFIVHARSCNEPGILERIIVGNYILGRDTIRIVDPKRLGSTHTDEARKIIHKLVGLSIIEETQNHLILHCSIDPLKFPIHTVIRRLYILASMIHQESIQSLIDNNTDLAIEAIRREDEADMMCLLALRLILSAQQDRNLAEKIGLEEPLNILGYRAIVLLLERMADWGENIAKNTLNIQKCKEKIPKQVIDWLSKINEISSKIGSDAIQSLYSGDMNLSNNCIENYKKIVEHEEDKFANEISTHIRDPQICAYLRNIIWGIKRIGELGAEIAEIAINRILEKPSKFCERGNETNQNG